MREEAEARAAAAEGGAARAAAAEQAASSPNKPQAGFGRKSMWGSINQAAKSAKS
jgi:hypothetical protein